MRAPVLLLLVLAMVVATVQAVPTTGAATAISNNNFTMQGTGFVGTSWFQWGMAPGQSWAHTPNESSSGGIANYTLRGTPVFGATSYYYRACDSTGCGSEQTVLTLPVVTVVVPTYDQYFEDMKENNFDPMNAFYNFIRPYTDITGPTIFYGLLLAMIFGGMWLRTRGTQTAVSFGMICISLFASSAVGLQLGLPPEFVAIGQALMYISLTGAIMAFTFR